MSKMQVYEGRNILGVESKFLGERTKQNIELLLKHLEEGDKTGTYIGTNAVAASLPNADYGHILDAMIFQYCCPSDLSASIKKYREIVEFFDQTSKKFEEKFDLKGIYFIEEGFLGFNFQDNFAIMFYIGDPKGIHGKVGSKTIPFFKHLSNGKWGKWIGRMYDKNGELDLLNIVSLEDTGPTGQKFAKYLSQKL